MDDKELLAITTAVILSGLVGGERMSADEKTIKRAIELASRLKALLSERAQEPVKS